jgi:hypothetical protein
MRNRDEANEVEGKTDIGGILINVHRPELGPEQCPSGCKLTKRVDR